MKRFIITIALFITLVGSVFATDWIRITCDNAKPQHIVNVETIEKIDCRGTTKATNSVIKVTPNNKEIELPLYYDDIHYIFEMENVEIVYEQKGVQKSVIMFDTNITEDDSDYFVDITLSSDYWIYEKNLKLGNINELEYNIINTKWEIN